MQWQKSTVGHILSNALYIGRAAYGKTRVVETKTGRRRQQQPEENWLTIPAPRIVSDEEFRLAEQRIRRNASLAKHNVKRSYPLRGLLFCTCGVRLSGGAGCGKRRYYRNAKTDHAHLVRADKVEVLVWSEVLLRAFLNPGAIPVPSRLDERDEAAMRLDATRAALEKLPAERERVSFQHQEGYLDWPAAKARLDEIRQRRADLEEERDRLEAKLTAGSVSREQEADLDATLKRYRRRLKNLTDDEKALILRKLVNRVTMDPGGRVEIDSMLPVPETDRDGRIRVNSVVSTAREATAGLGVSASTPGSPGRQ